MTPEQQNIKMAALHGHCTCEKPQILLSAIIFSGQPEKTIPSGNCCICRKPERPDYRHNWEACLEVARGKKIHLKLEMYEDGDHWWYLVAADSQITGKEKWADLKATDNSAIIVAILGAAQPTTEEGK